MHARSAIKIDGLMETTSSAVSPQIPPQRQRAFEQPALKRLRSSGGVAHACVFGRYLSLGESVQISHEKQVLAFCG
jgi:hypothetical protein